VAVVVDRGYDLRVVGHLDRQRSTSVERLVGREHAGTSVVEGSQLEGVLVRLRAGVDHEELVVLVTAGLAQAFSQLNLQFVDHGVGIEAKRIQLLRHHLHVVRVAMPDADDSVTTVQIKVLLTLVVPYLTTFPLHDIHVEERIYIEKFHIENIITLLFNQASGLSGRRREITKLM